MSGNLRTIHVRVNDAATGQPTPVRIRFTGPDGKYYAPLGRLTNFATGQGEDVGGNLLLGEERWAYIDGTCEILLPDGAITVNISKGFEYKAVHDEINLPPGKMALRFTVERWVDLRNEGWYSGDTRAHYLTTHAALLEAAAEDLAVVNLLAFECQIPGPYDYTAIPNILAFSGQQAALVMPGHAVVVNTLNTHPVLGSLGLLNCHRIVFPLSFGGPNRLEDWTLADWCDQCHRKGGLVVWTKVGNENKELAFGEPLADLLLGKIDGCEIDFFEDSPVDRVPDWYALLNCDLQVPLVGASGKDSNGVALGAMRTYARLHPGEQFTYKAWIEAIRSGRTVATNGPLLLLKAGDKEPGETLEVSSLDQAIHLRAEAKSPLPFDLLEIVSNGRVIATKEAKGPPATATIEADFHLEEGGWLAARCRGKHSQPAHQRVFAHTSPVYVRLTGEAMKADPASMARLGYELDKTLDWVQREARFENDQQRERLAGIFQEAKKVLWMKKEN